MKSLYDDLGRLSVFFTGERPPCRNTCGDALEHLINRMPQKTRRITTGLGLLRRKFPFSLKNGIVSITMPDNVIPGYSLAYEFDLGFYLGPGKSEPSMPTIHR